MPKQLENNVQDQHLNNEFQSILAVLQPYVVLLWQIRKKILLILSIEFVLIVAFIYLFARPYYESTVTILPDYGNQSMLGSLSSLASLAGVSVGNATPTDIYENLVTSESVLGPVIESKYLTQEFKDSVNLIEYFGKTPSRWLPVQQQERGMFLECYHDLVKHRVKTDLSALTKILDVTVKMPESELSAQVVNRITESLDKYVRTERKSNAKDQRIYVEMRIRQVQDSLALSEDLLKKFQEENKVVQQSPELLLEQSRLSRNIEIFQTVFVQLTQQLELSKIDEIRDAPVLNIKEPAKDPIKKAGPQRILYSIILMFIFGMSTLGYFVYQKEIKSYWTDVVDFRRDILRR